MDGTDEAVRPGRRWKRATIGMLVLGPPAALVLSGFLLVANAHSQLQRAIDRADRLDPGWRFEELQAKRRTPSEAENAAVRVEEVFAKLPSNWLANSPARANGLTNGPIRGNELLDRLGNRSRQEALTEDLRTGLDAELTALRPALERARSLAGMMQGRSLTLLTGSVADGTVARIGPPRQVGRLLHLDAIARSDAGDIDGALDSCRALLATARSIGDEPLFMSQLVRIALEEVACKALDGVLAQGQGSESALSKIQEELTQEAAEPLHLIALRGERAYGMGSFQTLFAAKTQPRWSPLGAATGAYLRSNEGGFLDFSTSAVELAKRPLWQQADGWDRLFRQVKPQGGAIGRWLTILAYQAEPAYRSLIQAYLRSRSHLHVCIVMAAAERHRLDSSHWPDSAADLAPGFPTGLPLDPYSGGPIRIARHDGGIAVYGVGADRRDNGGIYHPRGGDFAGMDLGGFLWDVDRRHRAPSEADAVEGP